jgi:transposase
MRIAPRVQVSHEQRRELESYARGRSTPARLVLRAKIVLLAAEGRENREIALELGVTRHMVGRWRSRFVRLGLSGIEKDAPRSGRQRIYSEELVQEIVRKTTQETPPDATHWSTRSMAKAVGVSDATVRRVLEAAWSQASFGADVQAQQGPAVCGEDGRSHWALPESTRARARLVCG